jgi:UDP-N-acetylmuramate dehydrogenase
MMAAAQLEGSHPLHGPDFASFHPRIRENADLSRTNWFRVGGPAQFLFKPEDVKDLAAFLKALPKDIPVTVLGVGSNLIVRDGGIDGVVIKLGRGFAAIEVQDGNIIAGAGALDLNVALVACDHSLAGLEFLSGIPGTIGGAVRMNGGAYGSDISQILIEAEIVERSGQMRTVSNAELGFAYRNSALTEGAIVTKAVLRGMMGDKGIIADRIKQINTEREETQPVRSRTGGSTFKNPDGQKAWQLIDKAGCRGLKVGEAQVSEKHCNFLINTGNATARDLEALGEEVRKRVKEQTGVLLEWEIKRIGNAGI